MTMPKKVTIPRIQWQVLVFAVCAFAACRFSPAVQDGRIRCTGPKECPPGYACVMGDQTSKVGLCCKDKGCWNKLFPGDAGDAPIARLDGLGPETRSDSSAALDSLSGSRDSTSDIPRTADTTQDEQVAGTGGTGGAGGTSGAGGTPITGGTSSAAGTSASGGTSSEGGILVSGGNTGQGGISSSGGTTSEGGTSSSGGTTSEGGILTSGGTSNAGGTSSSGGTTGTTSTFSCQTNADCGDTDICQEVRRCVLSTHTCVLDTPLNEGDLCASSGVNSYCRSGKCTPVSCGNKIVEPGEECDDGNTVTGDGCDACRFTCVQGDSTRDCTPANPCLQSTCNAQTHTCPPATNRSEEWNCGYNKFCHSGVCKQAVCGDGIVDPSEVCDDGHQTACGPCNADCTGPGGPSTCGDGILCPDTEACDDGHQTACGPCNADCTGPGTGSTCGDGIVCPDTEACDDGSKYACGMCSSTCKGDVLSCCPVKSAGNVAVNPGFDTDITGWVSQETEITLSFSADDATSCSTSGSLMMSILGAAGYSGGIVGCAPAIPGQSYDVGGKVKTLSGGAPGQACLIFDFYDQPNCQGNILPEPAVVRLFGSSGTLFDTWEDLRYPGLVAPTGAASMGVQPSTTKFGGVPSPLPFRIEYDMLYAIPSPGYY